MRDEYDDIRDQEEDEEPRGRRRRDEEDEKKKEKPPIICGGCMKKIKPGDAVFEVDGSYMNSTRRRMIVCYQCAYHPPQKVVLVE